MKLTTVLFIVIGVLILVNITTFSIQGVRILTQKNVVLKKEVVIADLKKVIDDLKKDKNLTLLTVEKVKKEELQKLTIDAQKRELIKKEATIKTHKENVIWWKKYWQQL